MPVPLPYDIFPIIFKCLRYNRNALFSCALVNRSICRMVIPLLWKNPFVSSESLEDINPYQSALLIRTYLACLEEEERRYLSNKNVDIRNFPKPLFDYAHFLEEVMYSSYLYNSVLCWILLEYRKYTKNRLNEIKNIYQFNESKIQYPLINSLYHMFFKKSKIKTLGISIDMLKIEHPIDQQLFNNMSTSNLPNLSWLIIYLKDNYLGNQHSFDFLLNMIKKWCHRIQHVRISNLLVFAYKKVPKIQEIISQQSRLQKLDLLTPKQNVIIDDILLNLRGHDYGFLTEMEVHDTDLSEYPILEGLLSIQTLKSLFLLRCKGVTTNHLGVLSSSSISLNKLRFISNEFPPGLIISTIGKTLRELRTNQLDREAVESLLEHCFETLTRLEVVGVTLRIQGIFYNLIKKSRLDYLKVCFCKESAGRILNDLGNHLPTTLKSLALLGLYAFKGFAVEDLENLLSNCNDVPLESLEIYGTINHEILLVILNYVKDHRRLKSLIIKPYGRGWEEKELSLLKDINKYGIKMIVN